MLHRVFLPQLGQTMEEGTLEEWHKQEGDRVEKGELLYELTTDKATLEVEAFAAGILKKILVPEGRTVPVNTLVAVLGEAEDELPEDISELEEAQPAAAGGPGGPAPAEPSAAAVVPETAAGETPGPEALFASPRARKIADEREVPLGALAGSGPGGRIIERDVRDYLDKLDGIRYTPTARSAAYREGVNLLEVAVRSEGRVMKADVQRAAEAEAAEQAEEVALSPMRATIAERMTRSKQTVPHFYLVGDVAMDAALQFLKERARTGPPKPTVTGLLVKAVGLGLKEHPRVNARFAGEAIVLNPRCNVGVAVAVEEGLFVPVIREADRKGLAEISAEIKSLAESAREGRLIPEQYEGGCITVSNLGMFGVSCFLPIINPPESCIVGVGEISQQPVADQGGMRLASIMQVSLSADHRVVDGAEAAAFFRTVKELLEEPQCLAS